MFLKAGEWVGSKRRSRARLPSPQGRRRQHQNSTRQGGYHLEREPRKSGLANSTGEGAEQFESRPRSRGKAAWVSCNREKLPHVVPRRAYAGPGATPPAVKAWELSQPRGAERPPAGGEYERPARPSPLQPSVGPQKKVSTQSRPPDPDPGARPPGS